jgi:hypothetical protein
MEKVTPDFYIFAYHYINRRKLKFVFCQYFLFVIPQS